MFIGDVIMFGGIIFGVLGFLVGPILDDVGDRKRAIKNEPEYVEYETAELLDEIWDNPDKNGTCDKCGMKDVPILTVKLDFHPRSRCQWCAELQNIKYHLKTHGIRRFK